MSNFDSTRFKTLLKYEITTQRKTYLRLIAASYIGSLVYMVYSAMSYLQNARYMKAVWPEDEIYSYNIVDVFIFCNFFVSLVTLISVSHIFGNMDTKQNRTRFLMLPATNLEKFLCRWSIYVPIAFFTFVIAYLSADLTAALIRVGMGLPFQLSCISLFSKITSSTWQLLDVLGVITVACSYFATVSTYVLGGTLFRKVPFILTSIIIGAIWTGFVVTTLFLTIIVLGNSDAPLTFLDQLDSEYILAILSCFLTAWGILAHRISYRIFCRSSVIGHKTLGM